MAAGKKNTLENPDMQETMSIKELAEKASLTPRTIRYYEEIGILDGIKRDRYSRRRYTKKDLYRLRLTKRAKELLGLSLDDIKRLSKHYRREDPGEKFIIQDSIEVLKNHLQMIDDQLKKLKVGRKILIEEIKRLEILSKKRGHKI